MLVVEASKRALATALLATALGCHSQTVVAAKTCGPDPCCQGQPAAIDCAENPDLSCVVPGDACSGGGAPYGCVDGAFFEHAPPGCPVGTDGDADADSEGGDNLVVLVEAGADASAADGSSP